MDGIRIPRQPVKDAVKVQVAKRDFEPEYIGEAPVTWEGVAEGKAFEGDRIPFYEGVAGGAKTDEAGFDSSILRFLKNDDATPKTYRRKVSAKIPFDQLSDEVDDIARALLSKLLEVEEQEREALPKSKL